MAFFEAAVMHARVLNDFLTVTPNRYPDDTWAGDYIKNWKAPSPSPLKRAVSVAPGRGVKETINKQLAHFSIKRLQQTAFYIGKITAPVIHDMSTFANDTDNVCYSELEGIRALLNRNPWPTTAAT
jgi:hypothetical protein